MLKYVYILLAAGLYILSFPAASLDYFAWFALIPLFLAAKETPGDYKRIAGSFLSFGIITSLGLLYWVAHVSLAGYLTLAFYFSLYPLLFGLILYYLQEKTVFSFSLTAALAWTALEYIKTHLFSGFPWALLGSTQFRSLMLIQIASITGVYGISFLLVYINAAVFETLFLRAEQKGFKRYVPLAAGIFLIVLSSFYGKVKIERQLKQETLQPSLKVALVQGNIPPVIHWNPQYSRFKFEQYKNLSLKLKEPDINLIIWPEGVVDGELKYLRTIRKEIKEVALNSRAFMLLGSNDLKFKDTKTYYNTAFFISPLGEIIDQYYKIHLVPFGEYVPLKNVFPFLKTLVPRREDFSPGDEYTLFYLKTKEGLAVFSTLICFEDIFPNIVRKFVYKGAGFLINITNDGWFKQSGEPYQHAALAVFRAVENNVYLIRATNTGFSCVINPSGKIVAKVADAQGEEIWTQGIKIAEIYLPQQAVNTFYTIWGDLFSIICVMLMTVLLISSRKGKNYA